MWEYKTVRFEGNIDALQDWLNTQGKEGWELCDSIRYIGPTSKVPGDTWQRIYVFKRKIYGGVIKA